MIQASRKSCKELYAVVLRQTHLLRVREKLGCGKKGWQLKIVVRQLAANGG
jgi:hypothetical protein